VLGSLSLLASLLACVATTDVDDTATAADTADHIGSDLVLQDVNNYVYSGTLDAPSRSLASLTDADISWSTLASDIQCHDVDPVEDIDNASLLVFPYLTEEEVEVGFTEDTLVQKDLGVYLSVETGDQTTVSLSDFTFFGTEVDIHTAFAEDTGTWLVLLATGTQIGVGTRMLTFIEPSDDATQSTVEIEDGCGVLEVAVDLQSLEPVPTRADGPWPVSWDDLTQTGQGNPFVDTEVSEVWLARYAHGITELEDAFLDLELLAEETWTLDHPGGTTADLADATTSADTPFSGFDEGETWLLALMCGTCPTPAPLFLTVLEP